MSKPAVAKLISDIGHEARRRINELPKKDRTMGWACLAAAVTAAGLHDSDQPEIIIDMVNTAINAMAGFMEDEKPK